MIILKISESMYYLGHTQVHFSLNTILYRRLVYDPMFHHSHKIREKQFAVLERLN